jgi:ABC-type antimicrobial peptide transport system permease subunit
VALGASPRHLRLGLQREAMAAVAVGGGLGVVLSVALGRTLDAMLFEVGSADPIALAGSSAVLMAAAWLASWIPARRSASIDPARALREE